jgi:hypothetical protein
MLHTSLLLLLLLLLLLEGRLHSLQVCCHALVHCCKQRLQVSSTAPHLNST